MKKITFLFFIIALLGNLVHSQTYFSDDFSDMDISDWTLTDADGDSNNWSALTLATDPLNQGAHVTSASWAGSPLTPDNWMVSPAISLAGASSPISLQWTVYAQDQSWAAENYTVYVGTSSSTATLVSSSTTFNESVGTSSGPMARTLDVSSFAGQTIYVAFRHHNVTDQFRINLDNVVVSTPVDRDAVIESVSLDRYGLIATNSPIELEIRNNGSLPITSLEINWNDGTDHISTINATIAPGATSTILHPTPINYAAAQESTINITVSAVNGMTDQSPADNTDVRLFNSISQAGTKAIVVEQATGSWCGWCPRGKVGLDFMATTYPNSFIGIEVHNGDPMAVTAYDAGITGLTGGGWPNSAVNRTLNGVDPGQATLQAAYNELITSVVPVDLDASSTLNGSTLSIIAGAEFYTNFTNSTYRLAAIITEDNVTGTTTGFNQSNFYSGGASGPMGGYENLPNPIPFSQIAYEKVGRALLGGFDGVAGSVPAAVTDGFIASTTFTYNVPSTSDINNMNIVVILIDETDGSIVNGREFTVNQTLSSDEVGLISNVAMYPNPASDVLNVRFDSTNISSGDVTVFDMMGRTVYGQKLSANSNAGVLEVPVSNLNQGKYIIKVTTEEGIFTSSFLKN